MSPGLVWLLLIPIFGVVWEFFVVIALGKSLGNEYRSRGMPAPTRPGQSLGLAMACVNAVSCAIGVGFYAVALADASDGGAPFESVLSAFSGLCGVLSLAGLVLWIIYWVKIYGFSQRLGPAKYWTGAPAGPPAAVGRYCWKCGTWSPGGAFCPVCGVSSQLPGSQGPD